MNRRQGKIGRQEALCIAAIAACASAIFTTNNAELYARGNSAYISMPMAAAIAVIVFLFLANTMCRMEAESLYGMFRVGLGPILGRLVALFYACMLLFMASALLEKFIVMMNSFIFPKAAGWEMLLYLLPASFLPAWFGLEGIGRVSRLLVWVLLAALLGAILLSSHNYETHRLAPFLGDGALHMLRSGMENIMLFLPALLGLLIAANGVHGPRDAKRAGYVAGAIGGGLSAACQLCLGMTYTYRDLAQMHSPMYRLTMGAKTGGFFPRLDTMLLFGWVLSGMIAAAYYLYVAALLFCEAFDIADIRPVVASLAGIMGGVVLILYARAEWFLAVVSVVNGYGFLLITIPALLAAILARIFRRNKRDRKLGL